MAESFYLVCVEVRREKKSFGIETVFVVSGESLDNVAKVLRFSVTVCVCVTLYYIYLSYL